LIKANRQKEFVGQQVGSGPTFAFVVQCFYRLPQYNLLVTKNYTTRNEFHRKNPIKVDVFISKILFASDRVEKSAIWTEEEESRRHKSAQRREPPILTHSTCLLFLLTR